MPDLALLRRSRAAMLKSLLVLSLHLLILFFALRASGVLSHPAKALPPVFLSLVKAAPQQAAQPSSKSEARRPTPATPAPIPVSVSTATAAASSDSAPVLHEASAPASTPVPSSSSLTQAEPPAVTEARFDAAYLNNPAPSYPLISRRNGEAGKVLLLVQVTKLGTAIQVEIAQSCGFARLDQAALEAVRHWRFVPARRGDEAIAASVLVPLTFRLNS